MPQIGKKIEAEKTAPITPDMAAIVESAPVAIFTVSLDYKVVTWNQAAERIFGYTSIEIIGRPISILIPAGLQEEVTDKYSRVLQGENIADWETLRVTKDGRTLPVSASISVVKDNSHKVIGFSIIIRLLAWKDFHRQKVEDNERLLSSVFSSIHDGLIVVNHNYTIVKANRAFARLLEIKADSVLGKKCYEVFFEQNLHCPDCPYSACLRTFKPAQKLLQRTSLSGREQYLNILHSPLILSNVQRAEGVIISIRDITSERQLETEMARLDGLNLVGEMAASIGHEVRNPMTTVRGFLQLMGKKELYGEDKEIFELMIDELDRANQIITQFLSLARNKKVDIQQHNINTLIEALAPLITADTMESGHQVEFKLRPVPDTLLDKNEFYQMLLNLLRNGREAMPLGGTLTIETRQFKKQPILKIRDEGIGIPSDVLKKLGTPFVTSKENGTGLGLAVCYSIAERNNAKIKVKTSDKGTEFEVRFYSV